MEEVKNKEMAMLKCWEIFKCKEKECQAYMSRNLRCWLFSSTHCRNEIQGEFLEKMEMCLDCEVFTSNIEVSIQKDTLKLVNRQFREFRKIVDNRDNELKHIGMELVIGLSEVFEALKMISAGAPSVRIVEAGSGVGTRTGEN